MQAGFGSWRGERAICERIGIAVLVSLVWVRVAEARPVYTILPANTTIHSVNDAGATTGEYSDGGVFLRTPDGTITPFHVSEAAQDTTALSINNGDTITGYYFDPSDEVAHSFIRTVDGTITIFDAPGAGGGNGEGTFALGINASGTIVGQTVDNNGVQHGFERTSDGAFAVFDVSHAMGTRAASINDKGAVAGQYADAHNSIHGFLRSPGGKITKFDVPGNSLYTGDASINSKGAITGYYADENDAAHGYIRAADGTFTLFDAPGPSTNPLAINSKGAVVGVYSSDDQRHVFGFVRNPDGMIETLQIPHSKGSIAPMSINTSGVIAGILTVRTSKTMYTHYGFIWTK